MAVGHKEFPLACNIVKLLYAVTPDEALIWHTSNETGGIGKRRGAQNKRLGVRAGVPDYLIFHMGNLYAIEVKAPGGRLTKEQAIFRDQFMRAGGKYAIARSITEAYDALVVWRLATAKPSQN